MLPFPKGSWEKNNATQWSFLRGLFYFLGKWKTHLQPLQQDPQERQGHPRPEGLPPRLRAQAQPDRRHRDHDLERIPGAAEVEVKHRGIQEQHARPQRG